ncbi:hypothetical protein [Methylocapsa palsarum]|uniref:Molybdopterin molybdenumtransferase n=1 Tax=Methylocapsa palsarum TaxID=1612308 RepID=A0A1I3WTM0_9HYPH|nr:hypothetical protein [Methylocapsa palsarum]SFK10553.1 Molybdopterin biosynthesis enzyme [Methylocapsa palsarum]
MNIFPDSSKSLVWSKFGRLTSLPDALAALAPFCRPVAPVLSPAEAAIGRIASEAVYALEPSPLFPVALRDGWAVAARDTIGASSAAPCYASVAPVRIAFGGEAPPNSDAVLPPNSVEATPSGAEIFETAAPGDGLRPPGSDFSAGELIIAEGAVVRPDRAEFLRLARIGSLNIRCPRVGILGPAGCGSWIASMARREGVDCVVFPSGVRQEELSSAADLFVALGEAGRLALERLAGPETISSYAVALRPGQTICGFVSRGVAANAAVFILTSERFECVFAAWLLLVRPCLRKFAGSKARDPCQSLPLTRKIASNPGWSDLVVLRRSLTEGGEAWEPLSGAEPGWSAIARADAWLAVDPNCEGYASGQTILAEFL